MVKCAAFGCKSGYDSQKSTSQDGNDTKISFHRVPFENKELLSKWILANPRKDWQPSKRTSLCSLHFTESDFVLQRTDKKERRKRKLDQTLVRRRLKEAVVPSLFPNAPDYCSRKQTMPRSTTLAGPSSRQHLEEQKLDQLNQSFLAEDDITQLTLSAIREKLENEETAPSGFTFAELDDKLIIYSIRCDRSVPKIVASLTLTTDHSVSVAVDGQLVPASQYTDLIGTKVKHISQLLNLLVRIKNWIQEPLEKSEDFFIETAIDNLRSALARFDDTESDKYRKVTFIVEQLDLACKNKHSRQYTPQLIILSYLISAASSAAYKFLLDENILSLPSKSTLARVTRRVNESNGLNNEGYLKLRATKLTERDRNVLLMVDEIYVAKRIEYSGGQVKGLTSDGEVATTLLCFMVKSFTGGYQDIVAMYPVCKLTAEKLNDCYKEVAALLKTVSLNVVAISADNAATNRKFFTEYLCGGKLKTHFIEPTTGKPVFLIFDPVHDLKNVYNNFQARKSFACPPMERDLPNGCQAEFQHIADLFRHEESMSLKKAHQLKLAALNPKSIEKTSTKLALSVFHESTRDALRFYAAHEGKTEWAETADFIAFVLKLWNVMNVKSCLKGRFKRDRTMDPVRSTEDWKLSYLRQCADFLDRWEEARTPGLTKETFLALRQTCRALADCATYMLEELGFSFVLLGKLQSDPIESRFGWFRQLSGANYFISVKQVLDSERKIKAVSLLKYSKFSLADIDEAVQQQEMPVDSPNETCDCEDSTADYVADCLTLNHSPTASDANVIYYVAGYMARSIVRQNKCDDCLEITTDKHLEPLNFDESFDYRSCEFFEEINRGGLARPSEFAFSMSVHCWQVYEEIKLSPDLKNRLMKTTSQRSLFCKVVDRSIYSAGSTIAFCSPTMCTKGHDLKRLFAFKFFNCVAKNLVRDMTNKADASSRETTKKRKISKLTSSNGL